MNIDAELAHRVKLLEMQLDTTTDESIAKHYIDKQCGELHLQWVVGNYWGQLIDGTILPNARKLYDALVAGNHFIDNKFTNQKDDYLYVIPTDNGRKVWVHNTQSVDFVYIVTENDPEAFTRGRFDVRRIFRESFSMLDFYSEKELIGTMESAINNAESLMECHNDSYEHSHRHSLEFYRKLNWVIPSYDSYVYGDFRDGGFVLSYEFTDKYYTSKRMEGAWAHWADLKFATDILCWALEWISEDEVG